GEIQSEIAERKRAELVGSEVDVLVESRNGLQVRGRTWREAPEVDAEVRLRKARATRVGDVVRARVNAIDGLDLVAEVA
ncbi:MAG TPA: hypothetical protein VFA34_00415, partial [Actinomycetota bacterium]|nr:hypothetical protein [Actinomycetota bacterium]